MNITVFFFFKQKTAYEMRISDWSSDVCSSDLHHQRQNAQHAVGIRDRQHQCLLADDSHQLSGLRDKRNGVAYGRGVIQQHFRVEPLPYGHELPDHCAAEYRALGAQRVDVFRHIRAFAGVRSEEHTSELPYLLRSSYARFCLKKKK